VINWHEFFPSLNRYDLNAVGILHDFRSTGDNLYCDAIDWFLRGGRLPIAKHRIIRRSKRHVSAYHVDVCQQLVYSSLCARGITMSRHSRLTVLTSFLLTRVNITRYLNALFTMDSDYSGPTVYKGLSLCV